MVSIPLLVPLVTVYYYAIVSIPLLVLFIIVYYYTTVVISLLFPHAY